ADIIEPGDTGRVFPLAPPPLTFNNESVKHFNALAGLTIFRGGALGEEYRGNAFVGESLLNLVHRRVQDVDDLQLQNYVSTTIVLVRNAASARSRGVELELRWLSPWELFSIRGSGALTDAVFTDYPNAPAPRGSGSPNQDLSGKRLPYAPQRQLNATP